MTKILLLIDVQESFRHRDYWNASRALPFLRNINALIADCQEKGIPIVRVFHCETRRQSPFNEDNGFVRPLQGLADFAEQLLIRKWRHSAAVGTPLLAWLREHGVREVIVAGIRTEQCCETTTRHLSDEGFDMTFATDATLTFDMLSPDGAPVAADDIHARTETVLNQRFARISRVASLIGEPLPT